MTEPSVSRPSDEDPQVRDLRALREANLRRLRLTPGTAAYDDAMAEEQRLVDRIRAWVQHSRNEPPTDAT